MPFAGYKDFDECVAKNSKKKNPKAYCATIQRSAEENMKNTPTIQEYRTNEVFDLTESEFTVEENTDGRMRAKVRLIKAGLSKNGRNYRPSALKEAVDKKLFDGVRMFENHSKTPPLQRPFSEMVSAVESTEYHEVDQAIDGHVVFFDRPFFEKAQAAIGYMGDSINSMVRGTRYPSPRNGVKEDIQAFVQPHSVDWVIYPAAGGEFLATEGEDMIDYTQVTIEDLRKNRPELIEALEAELKPEEKVDDKKVEEKKVDAKPEAEMLSREQVDEIVKQKFEAYEKERGETQSKLEATAKEYRDAIEIHKSLPQATRTRLLRAFEGAEQFDAKKVEESITAAKEELKAAGVGPEILGMGPSGTDDSAGNPAASSFPVHESVASHFGLRKPKKESTKPDSSKES